MSYIGTTKIGKMYLGSTEIAKAYLGEEMVFSTNDTPMPFDSKIEYIESTGTQYIDLDILPTNNTSVTIDLNWPYLDNTEIIGARQGLRFYEFLYNDLDTSPYLYYQHGGSSVRTSSFNPANRNVYKSVKNAFYVNDANVLNATANTFSIAVPLCLFCLNNSGTKERFASAKVYSIKIYQDEALVRDMTPVRVGQVGYLYDKISRQLFSNSGTGSFVLGSDI